MTATTDLHAARATLADLEAKRKDVDARKAAVAKERGGFAFAAHTRGGEAKKLLTDLTRTDAALSLDAQSLDAAIVEAKAHVAKAQRAVDAEVAAERRRQIEAQVAIFETAGLRVDSAVRELAAAYLNFDQEAKALRALAPLASVSSIQVNTERAVISGLRAVGLRVGALMPPNERHTVAELVGRWSASARALQPIGAPSVELDDEDEVAAA